MTYIYVVVNGLDAVAYDGPTKSNMTGSSFLDQMLTHGADLRQGNPEQPKIHGVVQCLR